MFPNRRKLLTAAAWGGPALACIALALPAAAAEPDTALERLGQKRDKVDPAAGCPFCRPGQPCPEHLV